MSTEIKKPEPRTERNVVLFDKADPACILNMLPDIFSKKFDEVFFENEELFALDETFLLKKLKSENKSPTATDNRLRLKFWVEYDRVAGSGGKDQMVVNNITAGVCTRDYFYKAYLTRPEKIAWLLCPPTGYLAKVNEGLDFGLDKMRDILALDPETYGKDKLKLMALQMQITKMFGDRAKGGVVQRVQQETKSVSVSVGVGTTATASEVNDLVESLSMEELDRRLKALKDADRVRPAAARAEEAKKHGTNADAIVVEARHVSDSD
jgi:hypothetical protein